MNVPVRNDLELNLEGIVSLETIRAHTKTLDIVSITDEQLQLYRESAFEAARLYTGLWLRGMKWMTEPIRITRRCKHVVNHKTRYPVNDGYVYLYGNKVGTKAQFIGEGRRLVEVLLLMYGDDTFNHCCNPCATNDPDKLMYQTGFKCLADIPAGIIVGMLKYIAFNIANAGDIGSSNLNERGVANTRIPSNDPVTASGAAAEWRRYVVGSFG